jgi:hypothetical protein
MRKLIPMLAVAVLSIGFTAAFAAEDKTVEGQGQCAKCALKEAPACQNVIVATEGGKEVKYYLVQNDVSKAAHQKLGICTAPKDDGPKIKATGTVEEKDGKMMLTASKIEAVEE